MPQAVYDYEQLHRDRLAARHARMKAEQKQYELARLRHERASLRLDLALLKLRHALRKYNPNQPRVPAGNPDGGRWTDGGGPAGSESTSIARARRLAEVIRVCILSGKSLNTDAFGQKTYTATYECAGGRTFTVPGWGHTRRVLSVIPWSELRR
jgi:hypothetical protein